MENRSGRSKKILLLGPDTVDVVVHGVGSHGAHPHKGKAPIVLGSQSRWSEGIGHWALY